MKDFLCFRKMIMPVIVQILFWLVVLYSIIIAVVDFAHAKYWYGVAIIIFGPLLARVAAELIMIFFRMNESLNEIKIGLTNGKDE